MKNFVFVTTARSDLSFITSIIDFLLENKFKHNIKLIATGTHFDKNIGFTIDEVRKYKKVDVIEINPYSSYEENDVIVSSNILLGLDKLNLTIDVLLILGDRYEILPLGQYTVLKGIPLVHFFGGECDISYCLDTLVRDSITKMAHIHFVSHDDIKIRLEAMGEESRRIFVMGNPSVTSINTESVNDEIYSFLRNFNINKIDNIVNVCYHPVTTDKNISIKEIHELLISLKEFTNFNYIWSGINNDPGYKEIKNIILEFVSKNNNHYFFDNLGKVNYFSLLKNSIFMIGNSSSGLLEAATFNLPVINIGARQSGRLHGDNVIDVEANFTKIKDAIQVVKSMKYTKGNPFVKLNGLEVVFKTLTDIDSFEDLMYKKLRFYNDIQLKRVSSKKD